MAASRARCHSRWDIRQPGVTPIPPCRAVSLSTSSTRDAWAYSTRSTVSPSTVTGPRRAIRVHGSVRSRLVRVWAGSRNRTAGTRHRPGGCRARPARRVARSGRCGRARCECRAERACRLPAAARVRAGRSWPASSPADSCRRGGLDYSPGRHLDTSGRFESLAAHNPRSAAPMHSAQAAVRPQAGHKFGGPPLPEPSPYGRSGVQRRTTTGGRTNGWRPVPP